MSIALMLIVYIPCETLIFKYNSSSWKTTKLQISTHLHAEKDEVIDYQILGLCKNETTLSGWLRVLIMSHTPFYSESI